MTGAAGRVGRTSARLAFRAAQQAPGFSLQKLS